MTDQDLDDILNDFHLDQGSQPATATVEEDTLDGLLGKLRVCSWPRARCLHC